MVKDDGKPWDVKTVKISLGGEADENGWLGGFCNGDGTNGFGIPNVTHWTPFVAPSNASFSRGPSGPSTGSDS